MQRKEDCVYRLGGSAFTSKKRVRRICRKILYETEYDPYRLSGIHEVPDKGKAFVRDPVSYTHLTLPTILLV